MAKKLVIEYNSNPLSGAFCKYDITLNGVSIIYANGYTTLEFFYVGNPNQTSKQAVTLGATIQETIQNTIVFFNTHWVNSEINYNIVGDTIEILLNEFYDITFDDAYSNDALTISIQDNPDYLSNLRYFILFDDWRLNIYKKSFQDPATEINGKITIDKGSVDEALSQIRGTGINVEFEANPNLTFDDFATEPEMTYICKLTKSGVTKYFGSLKPDGIYQSYTRNGWVVNATFVDGLGLIKDLSFVKPNGLRYIERLSVFETIENCLARTGKNLDINIACNIEYLDYLGTEILKDVYVNASRFLKDDGETIMSCDEVLTSVLDIFSLVITQEDGQWWIYRPNDFANTTSNYVTFRNYSKNTDKTIKWEYDLGSQIDGFYPHHAGGNQQIYTKGTISGYRINYKYGFLDGYVQNKNLDHDENLIFPHWDKAPANEHLIINDPQDLSGLKIFSGLSQDLTILSNTTEPISVLEGDVLKFVVRMTTTDWKAGYQFQIRTTDGLLWLKQDGAWDNVPQSIFIQAGVYNSPGVPYYYEYQLTAKPIPVDKDLLIVTYQPLQYATGFPAVRNPALCEITFLDLINVSLYDGKVGEFHNVQMKNPKSSIAKDTQIVYNGDSISDIFVGALYKADKTTLTDLWTRVGMNESKRILQISAEDDLRIRQNPTKQFIGDVYGLIPYLCRVKINNFDGIFQPIEWSYSINSNILNMKSVQMYSDELLDIEYSLTYDYGNTTKVTIK